MFDTLKKTVLTGVGLALRSRGEIEALAREFAENSKMNQEEAEAFLQECRQKYEEAKGTLDQKLETMVEKILVKLDLPTRSDIKTLNQRIDRLAEKITPKNRGSSE